MAMTQSCWVGGYINASRIYNISYLEWVQRRHFMPFELDCYSIARAHRNLCASRFGGFHSHGLAIEEFSWWRQVQGHARWMNEAWKATIKKDWLVQSQGKSLGGTSGSSETTTQRREQSATEVRGKVKGQNKEGIGRPSCTIVVETNPS